MAATIRVKRGGRVKLFTEMSGRLERTMEGPVGASIAEAVRYGEGSIEQQFASESMIGNTGGRRPWKRGRGFGAGRAMQRSGRLRSAWLGGSGSITEVSKLRVRVGVGGSIPYARPFQNRGSFVKSSKRNDSGRLSMQLAIGLKHGIWISGKVIERGMRIDPRPVSINPQILQRVQKIALGYVITGDVTQERRAA